MPSQWEIVVETSSGTTDAADATLVSLLSWLDFSITWRRRAVGSITVTIPQDGNHHLGDFVSGRQMYVKRDGVYWWAGFINAAYLPEGDGPGPIVLEGWNNAYGLIIGAHNHPWFGTIASNFGGFDADGVITTILDEVEHYSGTDWFPSAQRTIGSAAAGTLTPFWSSGKSALEVINEMADIEGWSWRVGVNSSGVFTFKVGSSAVQDLTNTLHAFTPTPMTRLSGHRRDGSRIVTSVKVTQRTPNVHTQLNGAFAAGSTNLTLDSTARMEPGDVLTFSEGAPTLQETKIINTVPTTTTLTLTSGLTNNQPDNANVRTVTDNRFRTTTSVAAGTVADAHHEQSMTIYDDRLDGVTRRTQIGVANINAYNHPLETVTLVTTDSDLIDRWLAAACEPGDTIKVSSEHPELSRAYSNTTVTVQEQTLTYSTRSGPSLTAQLGDPQLDALDEITRRFGSAYATATAVGGP